MELEIKNISAYGISLEEWEPQKPEDVWLSMSMEVGEKGDDAADIFLFILATPEGIRKNLEEGKKEHVFGRFYFIVKQYDWKVIRSAIQGKVKSCQSDSWEESVRLLSRNFSWEYEDNEVLDLDWLDEES